MIDDGGDIGKGLRLKMDPHPIEQRLKMLQVPQLINTNGRPLSAAMVETATREGLKIRAYEAYRMLYGQLDEFFQRGLITFPQPLNFRVTGELAAMSAPGQTYPHPSLPSEDQFIALEMALRYLADDISICRDAVNDHKVDVVDQALKTEPKK